MLKQRAKEKNGKHSDEGEVGRGESACVTENGMKATVDSITMRG